MATAIMALGLLALYAVMSYGLRANRHGEQLAQATYLAREMLALIKGKKWAADPARAALLDDAPGVRKPVADPPFQADLVKYAESDYRRNVVVRRLAPAGSFEHDIASLKVTLYWPEGAREEKLALETYDRL